jgi:hypothetical protein
LDNKENERIEKIQITEGKRMKQLVIYAVDCFVSSIIVGPMVIAHWRGIWVLMDFHENM